jgi:transcriptional regulator with XRE-family HTH domain
MDTDKSLGQILQEIRKSKHITIAQMSDKFKVAAVHLNLIEVDKRLPGGELLEQIIKMFELDGNMRDKLYLLLAKAKLQDKIPDEVSLDSKEVLFRLLPKLSSLTDSHIFFL